MAGQERGGKVSNEFFHHCLTVKMINIVTFSLIIAEIKLFFRALISGVRVICVCQIWKN